MTARTFLLLSIVMGLSAVDGASQDPPVHGYVRATAGTAKQYLDEPWHYAFGGSVRAYLAGRWSVEPEFMAVPGERFRQWSFVPNVAYDLGERGARATPYLIGGIGYFHELDKSINYERNELAWNGGIGLRVRFAGRLFGAAEFRIGHLTRAAFSAGYLF